MSNVIQLRQFTRDPHDTLRQALDVDWDCVIVIGYDKNGKEGFASSTDDAPEAVWLVEWFKSQLLQAMANDT